MKNKKDVLKKLEDIAKTSGVTMGLMCSAIYGSTEIYNEFEANAPQLQEAFGKVGYEVLEKGITAAALASFLYLTVLGGAATYAYLENKNGTE